MELEYVWNWDNFILFAKKKLLSIFSSSSVEAPNVEKIKELQGFPNKSC